jgi:hypothetical protein
MVLDVVLICGVDDGMMEMEAGETHVFYGLAVRFTGVARWQMMAHRVPVRDSAVSTVGNTKFDSVLQRA